MACAPRGLSSLVVAAVTIILVGATAVFDTKVRLNKINLPPPPMSPSPAQISHPCRIWAEPPQPLHRSIQLSPPPPPKICSRLHIYCWSTTLQQSSNNSSSVGQMISPPLWVRPGVSSSISGDVNLLFGHPVYSSLAPPILLQPTQHAVLHSGASIFDSSATS